MDFITEEFGIVFSQIGDFGFLPIEFKMQGPVKEFCNLIADFNSLGLAACDENYEIIRIAAVIDTTVPSIHGIDIRVFSLLL